MGEIQSAVNRIKSDPLPIQESWFKKLSTSVVSASAGQVSLFVEAEGNLSSPMKRTAFKNSRKSK